MLLFLFLLQLFVLRSLYSSAERLSLYSKQPTMKLTPLIQICKLKRWSLAFLFLLSVLCVRMSSLQAQEEAVEAHHAKCLEYFVEIIEVQKFREMLLIGAKELIRRHERGFLEKKELDMTLAVWHTTESELRHKVTKIYDTAYADKCFNNVSGKEKK